MYFYSSSFHGELPESKFRIHTHSTSLNPLSQDSRQCLGLPLAFHRATPCSPLPTQAWSSLSLPLHKKSAFLERLPSCMNWPFPLPSHAWLHSTSLLLNPHSLFWPLATLIHFIFFNEAFMESLNSFFPNCLKFHMGVP